MQTQLPPEPQQSEKPSRRGWLAAAAAFAVVVIVGLGANLIANNTSNNAPPVAPAADAGASVLTYTGTECIQSGPSEVGSFVQFALRNNASADVVMMFVQISDTSLEELVSDNLERFPAIEQWPPTVGHVPEMVTSSVVEAADDGSLAVSFNEPGQYGTVCWPLDGTAAIPGALLTIDG